MDRPLRVMAGALAILTSLACRLPAQAASGPYLFVTPPRESKARAERDYAPIAAFLTRALGHTVVYRHPTGWLPYEHWIWTDHAAIYFDGPQFVGWRLKNLDQTLGPRVPQPLAWRLYTWKGSPVTSIRQASAGATLCAPPVPNFGTLWASRLFPNPARQPYFRNMRSWKAIYEAVRHHTCEIGIGPQLTLNSLDPTGQGLTTITQSPSYPNQAFTISHALPRAVRLRIVHALLSPAGEEAMMHLRKRFAQGRPLVDPRAGAYKRAARALNPQWDLMSAGIDHDLAVDRTREHLPRG